MCGVSAETQSRMYVLLLFLSRGVLITTTQLSTSVLSATYLSSLMEGYESLSLLTSGKIRRMLVGYPFEMVALADL